MKRILIGLAAVVGFLWAIGCFLSGIGYIGCAMQGTLDAYWAAGAWQWVFLAPWLALGACGAAFYLWIIGDGILESRKD